MYIQTQTQTQTFINFFINIISKVDNFFLKIVQKIDDVVNFFTILLKKFNEVVNFLTTMIDKTGNYIGIILYNLCWCIYITIEISLILYIIISIIISIYGCVYKPPKIKPLTLFIEDEVIPGSENWDLDNWDEGDPIFGFDGVGSTSKPDYIPNYDGPANRPPSPKIPIRYDGEFKIPPKPYKVGVPKPAETTPVPALPPILKPIEVKTFDRAPSKSKRIIKPFTGPFIVEPFRVPDIFKPKPGTSNVNPDFITEPVSTEQGYVNTEPVSTEQEYVNTEPVSTEQGNVNTEPIAIEGNVNTESMEGIVYADPIEGYANSGPIQEFIDPALIEGNVNTESTEQGNVNTDLLEEFLDLEKYYAEDDSNIYDFNDISVNSKKRPYSGDIENINKRFK
jgi:hypothetical protein